MMMMKSTSKNQKQQQTRFNNFFLFYSFTILPLCEFYAFSCTFFFQVVLCEFLLLFYYVFISFFFCLVIFCGIFLFLFFTLIFLFPEIFQPHSKREKKINKQKQKILQKKKML
jgi:hypothetical protein